MFKISAISVLAALVLAAGLCGGASQSRAAAGSESWCIVDDEGNTHCNYASSQDCLQAVASGNRGFCNVNSLASPSQPVAAPRARHRR